MRAWAKEESSQTDEVRLGTLRQTQFARGQGRKPILGLDTAVHPFRISTGSISGRCLPPLDQRMSEGAWELGCTGSQECE